MNAYHEPVMGEEVLGLLEPRDGGLYLDGTLGGGGHTRLILGACLDCRVLAVDRDPEALDAARAHLVGLEGRVRLLSMRFDRAPTDPEARARGLDGALLDLGVSSHQLDSDARGFAFRRGVALDMRMNSTEGADARRFLADASEERWLDGHLLIEHQPAPGFLTTHVEHARRGDHLLASRRCQLALGENRTPAQCE